MWEEGQRMTVLYPVLQAPGFRGSQVQTVHSVPQLSLSFLGSPDSCSVVGSSPLSFQVSGISIYSHLRSLCLAETGA